MKTASLVAAVTGLFCVLSSSSFAQAKVEEVVLGPERSPGFGVSKTGLHVGVQVPKGSRFAFRVDGVEGPIFDALQGAFMFSPAARAAKQKR